AKWMRAALAFALSLSSSLPNSGREPCPMVGAPSLDIRINRGPTRDSKMERVELLKNLTFGARVAEEETVELAKYFVETDQWNKIFRGEIDVVRGDKGAGKSAIYSLLAAKANELFDKEILLVTAERPRGATVFKDLVAEPPTSENEFIALWKLYIATLIAQQIKELGIAADEQSTKKLIELLEGQGLLESDFDLSRLFKQVRAYARRWFIPKSIEGS